MAQSSTTASAAAPAYREIVSGSTHLAAVLLSVVGLVVLVVPSAQGRMAWHVVGFSVFGASLILLYGASAAYHLLPLTQERKTLFRRIDHMMIYVLIAGTYTPVCLTVLRGPWGWSLLGAIWVLAALGVFFKLFWLNAPRWLSTVLYVLMGWVAIVALVPLWNAVTGWGVAWLLGGGVWYTLGAVAYATRWPTIHPRYFTFHELFHVLVMTGSLAHFWFMYRFVLGAT